MTIVHRTLLPGVLGVVVFSAGAISQTAQASGGPIAVRNERPLEGEEVLVLRHQELKKGAHDDHYKASRAGVWLS